MQKCLLFLALLWAGLLCAQVPPPTTSSRIRYQEGTNYFYGTVGDLLSAGNVAFGSGTANRVARWVGSTTLGVGMIFDNNSAVGINIITPSSTFHVNGTSTLAPNGTPSATNLSIRTLNGFNTGIYSPQFWEISLAYNGDEWMRWEMDQQRQNMLNNYLFFAGTAGTSRNILVGGDYAAAANAGVISYELLNDFDGIFKFKSGRRYGGANPNLYDYIMYVQTDDYTVTEGTKAYPSRVGVNMMNVAQSDISTYGYRAALSIGTGDDSTSTSRSLYAANGGTFGGKLSVGTRSIPGGRFNQGPSQFNVYGTHSSATEMLRLQTTGPSSSGDIARIGFWSQVALDNIPRLNGAIDVVTTNVGSSHFGEMGFKTMNAADLQYQMYIDYRGYVGLGTITPTERWDLFSGTARIRSFTTAGNVVTHDATGRLLSSTPASIVTAGGGANAAGQNVSIVTGTVSALQTTMHLPGDISPSSISGSVNSYNPTGLATASTIRQDCAAGTKLSGIQGGTDGRMLIFHNISTTNTLTLINEATAISTAADCFILGGGDLQVRPGGSATFRYDATSSRWRLISLSTPALQSITYEFTAALSNYALSIPAGTKWVHLTCTGGGGGGGAGRRGANGSARCGGGGGAAGGLTSTMYILNGDATNLYINVGGGGSGGAGQTTNSSNGAGGTNGGDSDVRIDNNLTASRAIRAGGGAGGSGGTAADGYGGLATNVTDMPSTTGGSVISPGAGGNSGGYSENRCPGGGGAGGGITTSNSANVGGAGGDGYQTLQTGGAGGGSAAANISRNRESGGGGAGGNAVASGAAGAGGAGVRGGGGGGGGASTDSSGTSGAGGAGGDGYVKIVVGF